MTYRSSMKYRDNMGDRYSVKTKERGFGAGSMLGGGNPLMYGGYQPTYGGYGGWGAPNAGLYYPNTMYGGYYW